MSEECRLSGGKDADHTGLLMSAGTWSCSLQMDGDSGQAGSSQAEGQPGEQKELQLEMDCQKGDLEECVIERRPPDTAIKRFCAI